MTELQQFILGTLTPGKGMTAAELTTACGGYWGAPTIVRAINRLSLPAAGNADHQPRGALVQLVSGAGKTRRWAPTDEGLRARNERGTT